MCFGGGGGGGRQFLRVPTAPLAPAPAPIEPPTDHLPVPEPLETDVNPNVRRSKSKKDKNPATKGTGALRIKVDPPVQGGGRSPSGVNP